MKPAVAQVYFRPAFLENVITDLQYRTWLTRKAKYIIAEDRKRKRACVIGATARLYKELIHKAVCEAGQFDPFTGDALQWELVRTWDDSKDKNIDEAAELIHQAILDNGLLDPFTGEMLRWDLLGVWDDSQTKNPDRELIKKFSLLPTVDHVEPFGAVPGFEICSWLINRCKADMTLDEFVALCKKIIAFRG